MKVNKGKYYIVSEDNKVITNGKSDSNLVIESNKTIEVFTSEEEYTAKLSTLIVEEGGSYEE